MLVLRSRLPSRTAMLAAAAAARRARIQRQGPPIQCMFLATSSSDPIKGFYVRAKDVLAKFTKGVKELTLDGKQAFFSYRKLMREGLARRAAATNATGEGAGEGAGNVVSMTLRREYRHLLETWSGLTRLLPLIILWIPPGLGLLPPILFVYFPRQIFTRHFWTDEEREEYIKIHYKEKAEHYPALRQHIASLFGTDGAAEGGGGDKSLTLCSLREKEFLFHEGQKAGIEALEADHLRTLAKAVQVNKFHWMTDMLPVTYLRWSLRRRATEVFIDDLMLRASGTKEMTVDELRDACDLRGLPALGSAKKELLRAQLSFWLSLYDGLGEKHVGGGQQEEEEQGSSIKPIIAKQYWMWWPGHGSNSQEALASLLDAAKKTDPSPPTTTTTTGQATNQDIVAGGGQQQQKGGGGRRLQIGVPAPSLLLHMPALLDPAELVHDADK